MHLSKYLCKANTSASDHFFSKREMQIWNLWPNCGQSLLSMLIYWSEKHEPVVATKSCIKAEVHRNSYGLNLPIYSTPPHRITTIRKTTVMDMSKVTIHFVRSLQRHTVMMLTWIRRCPKILTPKSGSNQCRYSFRFRE